MAFEGTISTIIGILIGILLGLYVAHRMLKKRTQKILEDMDEKEVQDYGKEKNSQEESSEDSGRIRGRGRRGFFGRRGGREPKGFTDRKGRSFAYGQREPVVEDRELDSERAEPVKERGSIPIQPPVKSEGIKPVDSRPQRGTDNIQRQVQGRSKRNHKYSI